MKVINQPIAQIHYLGRTSSLVLGKNFWFEDTLRTSRFNNETEIICALPGLRAAAIDGRRILKPLKNANVFKPSDLFWIPPSGKKYKIILYVSGITRTMINYYNNQNEAERNDNVHRADWLAEFAELAHCWSRRINCDVFLNLKDIQKTEIDANVISLFDRVLETETMNHCGDRSVIQIPNIM